MRNTVRNQLHALAIGERLCRQEVELFMKGRTNARRTSCNNLYDVVPPLGGVCSKGSLV